MAAGSEARPIFPISGTCFLWLRSSDRGPLLADIGAGGGIVVGAFSPAAFQRKFLAIADNFERLEEGPDVLVYGYRF